MDNINSLLFTEASVGTTSNLQNVTFLQNAFMVTFFTYLGFEGLKYFIGEFYSFQLIFGESILSLYLNINPVTPCLVCNAKCFSWGDQEIQTGKRSPVWSDHRRP